MKNSQTLRKDAFEFGGWGRGLDNKMSRVTKRNLNRRVDKRRRKAGKDIINNE